ncbi:putative ubiquitin carboxyl-terminal hydrolase protein [Lasiodiplodia theobromae]|uniref:Ubiquitin carboxyl-terminal hydrolase n=1 Tax=Lasiodiplodia theobromae TaxID=45133 RepID=A0A5N5D537_9PEZI|nr:Ubiquitin carboxyl-terminal hydrolase [Lasiodiplodia theobromae]KAB2572856.1 Ubiquitin carboxyl-terminal hydrolase [Lasiodiplodia theobromae]KAF4537571.1 Ubiquitin carboxyl-terminal hydrolase [Lasiodiplodia theobromae]KAF9639460.1 putative ubiquitin carboxyl-terminal hydrolase protein [Lasiodiplodia theobromae]
MATRAPKRRKVKDANGASNGLPEDKDRIFPNDASLAATVEDKRKWQGFCEIENDPAFFNVMIQEFGVRGVKVQEVFGLDEALLAMLPKPVHGLIFLFRYVEDDFIQQESTCPDHVWFANQTTGNACATVALLNIIMNIPNVELGENLRSFKEFTENFTPATRGEQIVHYDFVKNIHNSFARKIDMMNIDLQMQHDSTSKSKSKSTNKKSKNADAAFHFIAFMPIAGEIWKLDGLDRQPQKLEKVEGVDWLEVIAPNLQARMAQYEEGQIEFGLLALVRDPLIDHRRHLAENIKLIRACEDRLSKINPEWKAFAVTEDGSGDSVITGPSSEYSITIADILQAEIPEATEKRINVDDDITTMIDLRQRAVTDQAGLRAAIRDEENIAAADMQKAESRRHDYGPAIQTWLRMLAEEGILKDLIQEVS